MLWLIQQMLGICCENGGLIEVTNFQEISANCVKLLFEVMVHIKEQRAESREQRAESREHLYLWVMVHTNDRRPGASQRASHHWHAPFRLIKTAANFSYA